jgi:hypothetical protein
MIRASMVFLSVVLLCVVASAQSSTPDSGGVNNGVYSNTYFGFSYTYPKDWVVHGEATNQRIVELGKERVKDSKALSEPSADVSLKHVHQLLTVFQYALGTPGLSYNDAVQIIAEDVRYAPAITDGRVYLLNMKDLLTKMGCQVVQKEPVEMIISGRQFFRLDFRTPVRDIYVQQVMIAHVTKGYALAFGFTVGPDQNIEDIVKTVDSLKFNVAMPHSPRRTPR